jgi:hypothetical protein
MAASRVGCGTRGVRGLVVSGALLALVACSKDGTDASPANGGQTANGGGGGAGGSTGGSSGAAGTASDCLPGTVTADAPLSVRRADIGTRVVGRLAGEQVIKLARDPLTGSIYYMSRLGGIWRVDLATGESSAVETGLQGNDFRGMTFGPDGSLYVLGHVGEVNPEISLVLQKGVPAEEDLRTWSTVATSESYPAGGSDFDHRFGGLTISPDGQYLFFGSGSRTDHGELEGTLREVPINSAIFRIPSDSSELMLEDDDTALAPYLFADGIRNAFDMAFDADGQLFATENGPDIDVPEEVNWIQEGHHYGFPWRFGAQDNPVRDANYDPTGDTRLHTGYQAFDRGSYVYDADFPPPPDGVTFTDAMQNHGPDADAYRDGPASDVLDASEMGLPLAGLTAHRSPLGLSFDSEDRLCGDYRGAGFVLSFGPVLNVMGDGGADLLLLQMNKVGDAYEMQATQIVAGFESPVDSLMVGNKLYIVEFISGGSLYEITLPERAP